MFQSVLEERYVLEYGYKRSLGPVMARFFTSLKARRVEGVRTAEGKVIVPPTEYDPATGAALDDWVDVGTSGVVTTWSWEPMPRAGQPLDRPFAWALIKLDGADTAMLHAVDCGDPTALSTGQRVRIRWRDETKGEILDIACFEPEAE